MLYGAVHDGADTSEVQIQLAADVQHIFFTNAAFAVFQAEGSVVAWGAAGDSDDDREEVPDCGRNCRKINEQLAADV